MPRLRFTDRTVAAIVPPVRGQVDFFDERMPGFGLRVTKRGHKAWIVMYRVSGRLRRLTLGPYPRLSLADARSMAKLALAAAVRGHDPAADKQADRQADTFGQLATLYIDQHAKPKKRSWSEDQRILDREALPRWRTLKVKEISYHHVQQVLDGIVQRGAPIAANRTLALLRKLFNFAVARRIIPYSPCQGVERPARERQRDRVLSAREIRLLWRVLEATDRLVRALFQLQLLTAQRGGELRIMRWEDVDLDTGWWTIPSSDAKNRLAHRVPLSRPAARILGSLRCMTGESSWVFPSAQTDKPRTTIQKALVRIRKASGIDFWPHDLRRTAASHMTSMGISRLTVAKILNHAERGITAVYDRHSYDREKREALEVWANAVEAMIGPQQIDSSVLSPNSPTAKPGRTYASEGPAVLQPSDQPSGSVCNLLAD
jgi:integrase